jgi:ABC-type glutathione transport system ATPase component
MSLLTVKNVAKIYPVEGGVLRRKIGLLPALKGVDVDVPAGASIGLVGESGSGKTTLGKIIARHLQADGGELLWESRPAAEFTRRDWAGRVQMVFQDPAASLNPKLMIRTQLSEALEVRRLLDGKPAPGRAAREEALAALLSDVGLTAEALGRHPHQFSGGQRQRLAIARALAVKPRLLVADEPVSSLDLSVQAQILNLLMDLKKRLGLTFIIISHDLAVVSRLADRIAVMKAGAIVESGATDDVLSRPAHDYTRKLLGAVPAFLK